VTDVSPLDWAFLPFQRFFDFSGRSARSEYWWFYLLTVVLSIIGTLIDGVVDPESEMSVGVAGMLLGLVTLVPWLSVSVRRLHDLNKSGWNLLRPFVGLVVFIGLGVFGSVGMLLGGLFFLGTCIWLLVLMCLPGTPGPNPYGEHPYGLQYYPS
jgi:uncharacterized membrane protein YhaH (DUF805 family)